jgi:acetylglutamate kinase
MAAPAVRTPLYILYLDAHHLGDDIFLNDLAQRFNQSTTGEPPSLILHGSGEKVERTLESQGYFPERKNGVLDVQEPEQVRLVERAVRETNQKLVATLTDEVVPTVGIQGVDRGLLQLDEEGAVTVSRLGWVEALLQQRVLPVVSALVKHPGEGRVREVYAAEAAVALAEAFERFETTVVFFTTSGQSGIADVEGIQDEIALDAIADDGPVPDVAAARDIAQAGVPVLVSHLDGVFDGEAPTGTRVQP